MIFSASEAQDVCEAGRARPTDNRRDRRRHITQYYPMRNIARYYCSVKPFLDDRNSRRHFEGHYLGEETGDRLQLSKLRVIPKARSAFMGLLHGRFPAHLVENPIEFRPRLL